MYCGIKILQEEEEKENEEYDAKRKFRQVCCCFLNIRSREKGKLHVRSFPNSD
jgi:hypothetical protein